MFVRNTDTGKWFNQTDSLDKEVYDDLRQDLEKTRLYSKCLSGSTYLPINSFENIYQSFSIDKIGFYVRETNTVSNIPLFGPVIIVNRNNSTEFYEKYLRENAFTIKNLFTPNKLIRSELNNYHIVDVATTTPLLDIGEINTNYIIDDIKLIEGHRVLVKDQVSEITLPVGTDPEVYFSTIELAADYLKIDDSISADTYSWYNSENGIYEYIGNRLVKTNDLDSYEKAYRYSVAVKMGSTYNNRQFHLERLKNGYFPVISENQNIRFLEKDNWVLRNRVDYNNIYDLNYYDIIQHSTQSVFIVEEGRTYSIAPRTIVVGEFGVIINNQDKISSSATYSISNIISNKFKTNIRSIVETEIYYWCCGDEGTLLRISKQNYQIKRIELDETSDLKSISFFGNLYGIVVGEYNTIWWTKDGGNNWKKLLIPEFDRYSYNTVKYFDLNEAYVAGNLGVFIELTYLNGSWIAYKRKISKQLDEIDEYILIEDINELHKTDWTQISSKDYVIDSTSIFFDQSLVYKNTENYVFSSFTQSYLTIELDSKYFGNSTFSASNFFISISVEDTDGIIYTGVNFANPTLITTVPPVYDFYQTGTYSKNVVNVNLPLQQNGNLKNTTFTVNVELFSNYIPDGVNIIPSYSFMTHSYRVETFNSDFLLIAANNNTVICYDIDNSISKTTNQFIYYSPTQSFSDVRRIVRENFSPRIFISGDNIYNFNFGVFLNSGTISNVSIGTSSLYLEKYTNRILFNEFDDTPYIIGNNSLNQYLSGFNFVDLDPSFNSRVKSKLLYLDYDIASKLNFFTDDGEYRLPASVTFSSNSFTQSFVIKNITGENNWINYYKDAEKTFRYYSSISDSDRVEFSTTFSYFPRARKYVINPLTTTSLLSDIIPLAPSLLSATASKFIQGTTPIASSYTTNYNVLLYKYLLIFKISFSTSAINNGAGIDVGDVLRLESDVVDCNLVVNRVERYRFSASIPTSSLLPVRLLTWPTTLLSGDIVDFYAYCYSDFNQNIIKNLQIPGTQYTITNLNKYADLYQLSDNFETHPSSIAYKLTESDNLVTISSRFNNKTAYYNLQAEASIGSTSKQLKYADSFLNFGYSPTYNLVDYLQRIDNTILPTHKFTILPEFLALPGLGNGSFTNSNIFVDLTVGSVSGAGITNSYYRSGTNQIMFGSDLKFYWTALLLHTFVDLDLFGEDIGNPGPVLSYQTQRLLITKKYYRSDVGGYVMEFNKKIQIDDNIASSFRVLYMNILTRNTLQQISDDLQLMNNIQRSSITKSVQYLQTFTNLENEIISKFSTDSYFKAFASDYLMRELLSAIIYVDSDFELSMSILNVEKEKNYKIVETFYISSPGVYTNKLALKLASTNELNVGDLINISFYGGTGSSQTENAQYFGLQTVIESVVNPIFSYVVTSLDYDFVTPNILAQDLGTASYIQKDAFFGYMPIDLFDLGTDKKVSRAIEIKPEYYVLDNDTYDLVGVDLEKFRYRLVDGLSLEELSNRFGWILEAEISDAIIGRDKDGGLIWYSGTWHCGRWFGGTWYSGRWVSGDWYRGTWNAHNTSFRIISVTVDDSYIDNTVSKWFNGRWFEGTWSGGTWYNGRRYSGDWNTGLWYDGIWNDGRWNDGRFEGGVWVIGNWNAGVFNCDAKPAYWLDGTFKSGDFENGIWYNGQFGNNEERLSRFGTKSSNSRTSLWHAGKWINGEFHSFLNTDTNTGLPIISEVHKYSIWRTGIWSKGNFYGGVAYNIDFRSGNWHGGILEEIQVIGVDPILPFTASTNSITINGIFKFNPGDEIWMIDDYRNGGFSPLGSNDSPRKYRINKILESTTSSQTKLYLNYNLSLLGVSPIIATQSYSDVETGLRIVSYFKDSYWKSGLWTNGIFDGGQFDSGIWYNGIFNGAWGN